MPDPRELVVCLDVPAYHPEPYLERMRALPGVVPEPLPVSDPGTWATTSPADPFDEPPPFAPDLEAERAAALARAQILVALHTPTELRRRAPRLEWVQGAGAGVEQFGKAGLRSDCGVVLTNAAGMSSGSMAEWVIGRLLQVWKRFRETDVFQQQHAFERSYGRTFAGSTIGILGLGHIGVAVASRARALGCRVVGLKRSAKPGDRSEDADALYPPESLHEMLAQCDAVIVSAPDTPETHHIINPASLAAMREGCVLVNVARGPLVDEAAVVDAIRSGHLGAAVLDVFDPEPLDPKSPLWDLERVYISAHSSVSVDRYMDDVFDLFLDNLQRYVAGEPLRNVVDMKSVGFG